jgi:hypothetical protein
VKGGLRLFGTPPYNGSGEAAGGLCDSLDDERASQTTFADACLGRDAGVDWRAIGSPVAPASEEMEQRCWRRPFHAERPCDRARRATPARRSLRLKAPSECHSQGVLVALACAKAEAAPSPGDSPVRSAARTLGTRIARRSRMRAVRRRLDPAPTLARAAATPLFWHEATEIGPRGQMRRSEHGDDISRKRSVPLAAVRPAGVLVRRGRVR